MLLYNKEDCMKNIIKNIDKRLLIMTIILFVIGLIMIYSASNVTAYVINEANPARYFIRQLEFLLLGLIGAIIMIKTPLKDMCFIHGLDYLYLDF